MPPGRQGISYHIPIYITLRVICKFASQVAKVNDIVLLQLYRSLSLSSRPTVENNKLKQP